MTVLQVVRDVCAQVGVKVPDSVFSQIGTNRTMVEMLALANEQAQRMAYDTREWRVLKKQAAIVGDGVLNLGADPDDPADDFVTGTTAHLLPPDYLRMLLTGNVWRSSSTQQPMTFISDTDDWMRRRAAGETSGWGEWTLLGDHIHIWPIMMGFKPAVAYDPGPPEVVAQPEIPATYATFAYLDRNCVRLASGGYGDRFLTDADSYRLDERLLKLNMIWQWKAHKGSPFAEDLGTYMDAMTTASGADKPAAILMDRMPMAPRGSQYGNVLW